MILINLLPKELNSVKPGLPPLAVRRVGTGITVVFSVLTLFFYFQYLHQLKIHAEFRRHWASLEHTVRQVAQVKAELEGGVKTEKDFIEKYVVPQLKFTTLFSSAGEHLPESAWLVELQLERAEKGNVLVLKGVALPSRKETSIQEIEKYLKTLRDELPPGTNLLLTTSRQQKEKLELTQFTAVFKWT